MSTPLTCVPGSAITQAAEVSIVPVVGPEVVSGSTRLKAGTAQKMVLNMLSTATMAKLGYVTGNRMTNVLPRNQKLRQRAIRIVMVETGLDETAARIALEQANNDTPAALVMIKTASSFEAAKDALARANGNIEAAVQSLRK